MDPSTGLSIGSSQLSWFQLRLHLTSNACIPAGFKHSNIHTRQKITQLTNFQEKFMTQPKAGSPPSSSNDLTLWEIPIAIATPSEPEFSKYEPKLWLNHYTLSASHRHSVSDWLIVNPEGKGNF